MPIVLQRRTRGLSAVSDSLSPLCWLQDDDADEMTMDRDEAEGDDDNDDNDDNDNDDDDDNDDNDDDDDGNRDEDDSAAPPVNAQPAPSAQQRSAGGSSHGTDDEAQQAMADGNGHAEGPPGQQHAEAWSGGAQPAGFGGVGAGVQSLQQRQAQQAQNKLKVEDALSYLDQVRLQFEEQPQVSIPPHARTCTCTSPPLPPPICDHAPTSFQ
jgi:histone deacetylase complex regulatory component SIN3